MAKLTPANEEEFKAIMTAKGMRARIKSVIDTNEVVKAVMARADIAKLSELDRYTMLAFHALVLLEQRDERLRPTLQ